MNDFEKQLKAVRKFNQSLNIRMHAFIDVIQPDIRGQPHNNIVFLDLYNDNENAVVIGEHRGGMTTYYLN